MINAGLADFIGLVMGLVLTLLVFSYLVGDNPLFRFTIHLFVGVSAGFAGAVALRNVILPKVIFPLLDWSGGTVELTFALVPLILSLLLVGKLSTRFARVGNVAMAYLVGVGAATAIGGAVLGTLFPQVLASMNLLSAGSESTGGFMGGITALFSGLIALTGTLATLIYFHFSARSIPNGESLRHPVIETIARVGQVFIAVTFGVLFAGVYAASLSAFIERWNFIVSFVTSFF